MTAEKSKQMKQKINETYRNMVFFNGYQYLLTDKNILIRKNLQTGEETRCKITKHKFFSAKEIEEYINKDTKEEGFKALPIWDSALKERV